MDLYKQDWDRELADTQRARALGVTGDDPDLYEVVARIHRREYDQAGALVDGALSKDPRNPTLRMVRASIALLAGQEERAIAELTECMKLPRSSFALWLRAMAWYSLGRHDRAFLDWAEFIRVHPRDPRGWLMRALARSVLGQHDAALADADEAVRLAPQDHAARLERASLALAAGRLDRALADADEAIRLQPANGLYHQFRAGVKWRTGDHAGAIRELERAVELQPDVPSPAAGLALYLATAPDARLRDGRRALTLATAAVERTHRRDPWSLQALAAAQAEVGQFPAASATAAEALRLPFDPPPGKLDWQIMPTSGRSLMVGAKIQDGTARATLRGDLEADSAGYHAGRPARATPPRPPLAAR